MKDSETFSLVASTNSVFGTFDAREGESSLEGSSSTLSFPSKGRLRLFEGNLKLNGNKIKLLPRPYEVISLKNGLNFYHLKFLRSKSSNP